MWTETFWISAFGVAVLFGVLIAWQKLWEKHQLHKPMSDDWRYRNKKAA